MSLEQAIERNTAALERLIGILASPEVKEVTYNVQVDGAALDAAAKTIAEKEIKKRTKKEAAPAAPAGEPSPSQEASAPSPTSGAETASATADAASATEPLTYAQVQAATIAAVKAGKRAEVVAVLEGYGVKRADQIDEAQWPEYLGKIEALG